MKRLAIAISLLLLASTAWGASLHLTGLTSSNNRSSYHADYSWLEWSGQDFSAYATGYEVYMRDSSGRQIRGVTTGAVGTGAATIDLASGWDLTVGWFAGANTTINDSDTFTTTSNGYGPTYIFFTNLRLYNVIISAPTNCVPYAGDSPGARRALTPNGSSWHVHSALISTVTLYLRNSVSATTDVASLQVIEYSAPSSSGIYVDWDTAQSDFNHNAITEIIIQPLATAVGVSMAGVSIQ